MLYKQYEVPNWENIFRVIGKDLKSLLVYLDDKQLAKAGTVCKSWRSYFQPEWKRRFLEKTPNEQLAVALNNFRLPLDDLRVFDQKTREQIIVQAFLKLDGTDNLSDVTNIQQILRLVEYMKIVNQAKAKKNFEESLKQVHEIFTQCGGKRKKDLVHLKPFVLETQDRFNVCEREEPLKVLDNFLERMESLYLSGNESRTWTRICSSGGPPGSGKTTFVNYIGQNSTTKEYFPCVVTYNGESTPVKSIPDNHNVITGLVLRMILFTFYENPTYVWKEISQLDFNWQELNLNLIDCVKKMKKMINRKILICIDEFIKLDSSKNSSKPSSEIIGELVKTILYLGPQFVGAFVTSLDASTIVIPVDISDAARVKWIELPRISKTADIIWKWFIAAEKRELEHGELPNLKDSMGGESKSVPYEVMKVSTPAALFVLSNCNGHPRSITALYTALRCNKDWNAFDSVRLMAETEKHLLTESVPIPETKLVLFALQGDQADLSTQIGSKTFEGWIRSGTVVNTISATQGAQIPVLSILALYRFCNTASSSSELKTLLLRLLQFSESSGWRAWEEFLENFWAFKHRLYLDQNITDVQADSFLRIGYSLPYFDRIYITRKTVVALDNKPFLPNPPIFKTSKRKVEQKQYTSLIFNPLEGTNAIDALTFETCSLDVDKFIIAVLFNAKYSKDWKKIVTVEELRLAASEYFEVIKSQQLEKQELKQFSIEKSIFLAFIRGSYPPGLEDREKRKELALSKEDRVIILGPEELQSFIGPSLFNCANFLQNFYGSDQKNEVLKEEEESDNQGELSKDDRPFSDFDANESISSDEETKKKKISKSSNKKTKRKRTEGKTKNMKRKKGLEVKKSNG